MWRLLVLDVRSRPQGDELTPLGLPAVWKAGDGAHFGHVLAWGEPTTAALPRSRP
jgi:hypothetical protein